MTMNQVDLSTEYLGLELAHPIIPSASPLTGSIDSLHQLVEAGAPAVVLPSLFEEQIVQEALSIHRGLDFAAGASPEAPEGYLPELDGYNTGPGEYLDLIVRAKEELQIPVIASLNGDSPGGWTLYAKILEGRGADALELNIYHVAADPEVNSTSVEASYLRLVESVTKAIDLPVAVKIAPFFSSMASFAHQLAEAGASALVLFNRFYQPDLDLETLKMRPNLELSQSSESRLVLRWIGMMAGRVDSQFAATTGIHTAEDVARMILVGADVTMMASALLRNGPGHLAATLEDVRAWFWEHGYDSVSQARGSASSVNIADPAAYERGNYMKTLLSYSRH